mgnify:CR=1 FL=1
MAIDPMLYEKVSGRKGDPHARLGEALARNVKAKHRRDALPKGVAGGFRIMAFPGYIAQIFYALKIFRGSKHD